MKRFEIEDKEKEQKNTRVFNEKNIDKSRELKI